MIAITKRLFMLSPLLALATRAFGQAAPPVDTARAAVVKKAVDLYFVPAYETLKSATARLAATVEAACKAPTGGPGADLKRDFAAVVAAWAGIDFLRFGPMTAKSRFDRFSYFPDRHGTGARQLRQILATPDPALLEPGALASRSAAIQGLQAFELLIFGNLGASETDAYRCQLALRIAENLDQIAGEAVAEWVKPDGWAALMEHPGGSNIVYRNEGEPVVEILKAIVTGLQQMRDQRMLTALDKSFASAKPARTAFVASDLSLDYLRQSGGAIAALIDRSDLFSLAGGEAPKLKSETDAAFADFRASTDFPNWKAAFTDQAAYDRFKHGFDVLKTLEDIFTGAFASAAGISPGFNALDGD